MRLAFGSTSAATRYYSKRVGLPEAVPVAVKKLGSVGAPLLLVSYRTASSNRAAAPGALSPYNSQSDIVGGARGPEDTAASCLPQTAPKTAVRLVFGGKSA